MTDEPAKRGRPAIVEIVVMWKQGIQLDTFQGDEGKGAYVPFRGRGKIDRKEFDAICAMDDKANREHRLMAL